MAQLGGLQGGRSHTTEEELVWLYYGEAENAVEVELHLTLCPNCRAAYEALKAEMLAIDSFPVPDRGSDYGQEVWRNLVRRDAAVATRRRVWWRFSNLPRRMALAGALASMLAIAFLTGRATKTIQQPEVAAAPKLVRQRILAAALSEHLEQSERTLMDITNREGDSSIDIRYEQESAENLLNGNRLYRQTATREGYDALADVLEDLERILLDIAHGSRELSQPALQQLRTRVEDEGLLFKLRILGVRLRDMGNQPIPSDATKISKGQL